MKKILCSILIGAFLLVGCGKDEPLEVATPVVEEVEMVNPYFIGDEEESNSYIVDFGYYYDYKKYPANIDITKIESTDFGDMYQMSLVGEFGEVDESQKDLGYYLVEEDLIVKLNSTEVISELNEKVTTDNVEKIGVIVCSESDISYTGIQNTYEVEYTITNNSSEEKIKFTSLTNNEAGSYEQITWKKGLGLVEYESGTGAEGYKIKLSLFEDEKKNVVKTTNYSGTIDDIPIHMELNYYETGVVDGSYYYDKFNNDIHLVGTRENDVLNLKTKDGSENIICNIHSNYVTGKWNSNGKALDMYLFNENNDEYSSNSNRFLVHGDYLYYTNPVGIYILDLKTESVSKIIDVEGASELNIYKENLYYIVGNKAYKANMDGSIVEEIDLGLDIYIDDYWVENFEIYKGRIYAFLQPNSQIETDIGFFVSTDLEGKDSKTVEYPKIYSPDYPDTPLRFFECFIYNDIIFFENGQTTGFDYGYGYKMNLDGTDYEVFYEPVFDLNGAGGEYFFSGWTSQNEEIIRNSIENHSASNSVELYHEEEMSEIHIGEFSGIANNGKYIATCLEYKTEGYYNFKVLDFHGNIVLDMDIEKPIMSEDAFAYFDIGIVGEYVYYYTYAYGEVDQVSAIKISNGMVGAFNALE